LSERDGTDKEEKKKTDAPVTWRPPDWLFVIIFDVTMISVSQ
jgi:hypothetical protein